MAKSFLLYFLLALPVALAQIMTATTKPPPLSANAVSFASIVPGVAAYTYIGCYQETANGTATNDVRALAGGTMVRNYSLTRLDLASVSLFQNTSQINDRRRLYLFLWKLQIRWSRVWKRKSVCTNPQPTVDEDARQQLHSSLHGRQVRSLWRFVFVRRNTQKSRQ